MNLKNYPTENLLERAKRVSNELGISLNYLFMCAGVSDNQQIRSECAKAHTLHMLQAYDIEKLYLSMKNRHPDIDAITLIINIADNIPELSPISVASIGRSSEIPKLKKDSITAFKYLLDKRNTI